MIIRNIICTLFFFSIAMIGNAQDYVITQKGDTIFGKLSIEDKEDVIYLKHSHEKRTTHYSKDIKCFYRAKKDQTKYSIRLGERYVFAEQLIEGTINYYKQDLRHVEGEHSIKVLHYILQKKGNDAVIIYPVKKKDGLPYLKYIVEDDPASLRKIDEVKFNDEGIREVIATYNQNK